MNRRNFLQSLGMLGLAVSLPGTGISKQFSSGFLLDNDKADDILVSLIDAALSMQAEYVDARYVRVFDESLQMQKTTLTSVSHSLSGGLALRVYKDGGWGQIAVDRSDFSVKDAAATACALASSMGMLKKVPFSKEGRLSSLNHEWHSPMKINPFGVPLGDKVEFLHSMTAAALKNDEIAFAVANLFCRKRESIYRNSLSGGCSQTLISTYPNCGITVFNEETRAIDTRTTRLEPQAAGWEVTSMDLVDEVRQAVLDILQYKRSQALDEGDYEVIFDPTHLWRVLLDTLVTFIDPYTMNGLDASNPSNRFISPKDMGRRIIGSKQFGLRFDNTIMHGLASTGWDDAGFPADVHKAVTEGRLQKIPVSDDLTAVSSGVYGSVNRAQGHMATRYAMPNIVMDTPTDAPTTEKMIADTKDGLFVSGRTRTMLSPGRTGFQSQGQIVRRIHNGVLSDMVRDVVYECKLSDFWKRLVQTGSEKEMFLGGDLNPQRIQPHWDTPFSVGTVPARFKNIRAYSIGKGNAK